MADRMRREAPTLDLPVDGYVRVSRVGDRKGDSYISPRDQEKRIRQVAKERGLTVVMHAPEENVSGGTMNRPVFNRIMKRIREGESGGVIVYTLDRFARNLTGGATALAEIAEHDAVFVSATEAEFDMTSASGRLVMQFHLMLAEYFRERTKESWANAVEYAVERGIHPAPYGAYGYDRVDRRLVPHALEAAFVREAFRRRVEERWPFNQIAAWLNAESPPR